MVPSRLQPSEILDWVTPGGLHTAFTLGRTFGAQDETLAEAHSIGNGPVQRCPVGTGLTA